MEEEIKKEERVAEVVETTESSAQTKRISGKNLRKLRKQIEFYFSDANLQKDGMLSKIIQEDENGYVDIKVLQTFNRVRYRTEISADIVKALSQSEVLELDDTTTKVRRKCPFVPGDSNPSEKTLYVEKIPPYADHRFVKNVFQRFGEVTYVRLPHFRNSRKNKGFGFVEFASSDSVQKACEAFKMPTEEETKKACESPVKRCETRKRNRNNSECEKKTSPTKRSRKRKLEMMERNNEKVAHVATVDSNEHTKNLSKGQHRNQGSHSRKRKRQISETESDVKDAKMFKRPIPSETDIKEDKVLKGPKSTYISRTTIKTQSGDVESSEETKVEMKREDDCTTDAEISRMAMTDMTQSGGESFEEKKVEIECEDDCMTDSKIPRMGMDDTMTDVIQSVDGKIYTMCDVDSGTDAGITRIVTEGTEDIKPLVEENCDAKVEVKGDVSEIVQEAVTETLVNEKRKRKKHQNGEKLKLRVMSLAEWRAYRNKYLTMQRKAMSAVKKMLMIERQQRAECDSLLHHSSSFNKRNDKVSHVNSGNTNASGITFVPGVIAKVALENPTDLPPPDELRTQIKSSVEDVAYIDTTVLGESSIYVRFHTPESATASTNSDFLKKFGKTEVITGSEESSYWQKLEQDRYEQRNKPRVKKRGRDKILEKATKLVEQRKTHIFFEN